MLCSEAASVQQIHEKINLIDLEEVTIDPEVLDSLSVMMENFGVRPLYLQPFGTPGGCCRGSYRHMGGYRWSQLGQARITSDCLHMFGIQPT